MCGSQTRKPRIDRARPTSRRRSAVRSKPNVTPPFGSTRTSLAARRLLRAPSARPGAPVQNPTAARVSGRHTLTSAVPSLSPASTRSPTAATSRWTSALPTPATRKTPTGRGRSSRDGAGLPRLPTSPGRAAGLQVGGHPGGPPRERAVPRRRTDPCPKAPAPDTSWRGPLPAGQRASGHRGACSGRWWRICTTSRPTG